MYHVTDSAENSLKPVFLFILRLVVFIMFLELRYFYLIHCTLATHLTVYNVLEHELYYTLLLLFILYKLLLLTARDICVLLEPYSILLQFYSNKCLLLC